jgi:hypothetical protein
VILSRRAALVAATLVLATVPAACGTDTRATPMCSLEENFNALVLEAQAVPTADRVPCIRALPAGWSVFNTEIERGRALFALSSDRAGNRALQMTFTSSCDTSGATPIPSDEKGTRRFERIEKVTPGFTGTRYYRFAGGCAVYRFEFQEEGRALANEATLALSFISRETLNEKLRKDSHGNLSF